MVWSFTATISFKPRGWVTVGANSDQYGFSHIGDQTPGWMEKIRNHPTMIDFLYQLGFVPDGGEVVDDITDLVLSFRVLVGGAVLSATGAKDNVGITTNNLEAVIKFLVEDKYFTTYIGCSPLDEIGDKIEVESESVPVPVKFSIFDPPPIPNQVITLTSQAMIDLEAALNSPAPTPPQASPQPQTQPKPKKTAQQTGKSTGELLDEVTDVPVSDEIIG